MAQKGLAALLKDYEDYITVADEERKRIHFPSGVIAINHIVANNGGQGIPGGTIMQLLGEAKHGKSTLSLDFIAQAQKLSLKEIEIPTKSSIVLDSDENTAKRYKTQKLDDKPLPRKVPVTKSINAALLDFEHSFDPVYAKTIGVDTSKLLVISPTYAEEGFNIAEALLHAGLQLLVIDSVGMLVAQSEEDKTYDDNEKIGSEAKVLGRFLKRANALIDLADGLIIVINHYRANLSPMARSDKKPYGARILQYAVKVTLKIARTSTTAGRGTTEVYVEKTKFGPEGQKAEFDIVFGEGIDYARHILTLAVKYGIVAKKGAWLEYDGIQAQGFDKGTEKLPIERIKEALIPLLAKRGIVEEDGESD